MSTHDEDWLRRELEAMTPHELDIFYLRLGRRYPGTLTAMRGKAVHHIDGDIGNNDLANLRLVDIAKNRRRKR